MGSLVPDLELGEHALVTADELCLLKAGKTCGVKSPPAGRATVNLFADWLREELNPRIERRGM